MGRIKEILSEMMEYYCLSYEELLKQGMTIEKYLEETKDAPSCLVCKKRLNAKLLNAKLVLRYKISKEEARKIIANNRVRFLCCNCFHNHASEEKIDVDSVEKALWREDATWRSNYFKI